MRRNTQFPCPNLSEYFSASPRARAEKGLVWHERAGEAGRTVNTLSFHSFGHTLTSIMANAGVPVEVWQKFTGGASPEMNAHYTHHEIEALLSAIGKLPTVRL